MLEKLKMRRKEKSKCDCSQILAGYKCVLQVVYYEQIEDMPTTVCIEFNSTWQNHEICSVCQLAKCLSYDALKWEGPCSADICRLQMAI